MQDLAWVKFQRVLKKIVTNKYFYTFPYPSFVNIVIILG